MKNLFWLKTLNTVPWTYAIQDLHDEKIGKVETTPVDLSDLKNVIKSDVVEKSVHDELVKEVNTIDSNK